MMQEYNLPINDERVQNITEEQLELMSWMKIVNDPELKKKFDETYYDPEFENELKKVEDEGRQEHLAQIQEQQEELQQEYADVPVVDMSQNEFLDATDGFLEPEDALESFDEDEWKEV